MNNDMVTLKYISIFSKEHFYTRCFLLKRLVNLSLMSRSIKQQLLFWIDKTRHESDSHLT